MMTPTDADREAAKQWVRSHPQWEEFPKPGGSIPDVSPTQIFLAGILHERERAAMVADNHHLANDCDGGLECANYIAAAIRRGA